MIKRQSMTAMFKITLPDGSEREVPAGTTPADIAAAIGPGLARAALAARVDGPAAVRALLTGIRCADDAATAELSREELEAEVAALARELGLAMDLRDIKYDPALGRRGNYLASSR